MPVMLLCNQTILSLDDNRKAAMDEELLRLKEHLRECERAIEKMASPPNTLVAIDQALEDLRILAAYHHLLASQAINLVAENYKKAVLFRATLSSSQPPC